jgi:hypothetical protein
MYTICIRVDEEGQLSVGVEREGNAQMPANAGAGMGAMAIGTEGGEGGEMEFRPAGSIKEAMMMVMDIYAADGDANGDSQFAAGFGEGEEKAAPITSTDDREAY